MASRAPALVSIAAVLSLVGSLLPLNPPPAAAQEVPAESVETIDATLVPPLESTAADPVASTFPEGDFAPMADGLIPAESLVGRGIGGTRPAPAVESGFDEQTSEVVKFTEGTTEYSNTDGSFTLVTGDRPINAKNDAGEWVPVSPELERQYDGSLSAEAHPLDPTFAPRADEVGALTLERGVYEVEITLDDASSARVVRPYVPRDAGDTERLMYPGVFEDVNLTYEVTDSSVKESLVLESLPDRGDASWTWSIDTDGLALEVDEVGSIRFVDTRGAVQFFIPTPLMWDSSGVPEVREPALTNIDTRVWRDGDTWKLELKPDYAWLADDDRVYPVTVDPTYQHWHDGVGFAAYRSDGAYRNDAVLVGNARAGGNTYWRTVVHYPYWQIGANQLIGTDLYTQYDGDGTTSYQGGNIAGATCHGYHCGGSWYGWFAVDSGGGWSVDDEGMTWGYANAIRNGDWNHHLLLSGREVGSYTYKRLVTRQHFTYKPYPAVTGYLSPSPGDGATNVSTRPTFNVTANDTGWGMSFAYRIGTTPNVEASQFHQTPWTSTAQQQLPSNLLQPNTTHYWKAVVVDSSNGAYGNSTERTSGVRSFTTNAPAPFPDQAALVPADGAVIAELTPTLTGPTVADANGQTVQYQFRISTGNDSKSGAVVSSGWLASPNWTVPAGVLQDGGAYTWKLMTSDGIDTDLEPMYVNRLTVNLRLGTSGPSPFDTAGPVTVNLANGNASLNFTSPVVNTVGGPMGLSFSYNSQQSPTLVRGLTASYYDALNTGQTSTTTFDFTNRQPKLVRTDPQVSFAWGEQSPGPGVPADYFMVKWNGFIQAPTNGTYRFGVARDNGARVTIGNGALYNAYNDWSNTWPTGVQWGSPVTMTNSPTAFSMDYFDATVHATVQLWVRAPDGREFIVPADWFSTKTQTLPNGWSASTAIAGAASSYAYARVLEGSVALTDVSGSVHTYTRTSNGGYKPPVGEYGVLSVDGDGRIVLSELDGTVYSFGTEGQVVSITTAPDAAGGTGIQKPATPLIAYRGGTGQVDRIIDPLSSSGGTNPSYDRFVRLVYAGDTATAAGLSTADSDSTGTACPVPIGFDPTPPGMLCRIIYPGHIAGAPDTTRLLYKAGQLARIIDPGTEITDFGYTNAVLTSIRDSTTNDWLQSTGATATTASTTTIAYQGGKVTSVTLPAPDGATASSRPSRTYSYGPSGAQVTAAPVATVHSSDNFELGTAAWTIGSAPAPTSAAQWRSSTKSMQVDLTAGNQVFAARTFTGLTPGRKYEVRTWIRAGSPVQYAGLQVRDSYFADPTTTQWREVVAPFTAISPTEQVKVGGFTSSAATLYVDDFTLTALPFSEAYAVPQGMSSNSAVVDVTGTAATTDRTVTFDTALRQLTDTSAMGQTAQQTWSPKDQVLSATSPQGLMSTRIYDTQDRLTDTYGPSPGVVFRC